jgi:hypothetical protein
VCDSCIKFIDEKLALGLSKRFGKGVDSSNQNEDDAVVGDAATPNVLAPEPKSNRGVLTMGRYRYVWCGSTRALSCRGVTHSGPCAFVTQR